MKALLLAIFFSGVAVAAQAQLRISTLQDDFNTSNTARWMPSFLGDGVRRVQVNVANVNASLGSNFATLADARNFLRADEYSDELIARNIAAMHGEDNLIAGALNVSLVNTVIRFGDEDAPISFSLGAGANERMELSTVFNRDAFLLAYSGNKQFAGQFVELAPRFNALAFIQYYVAAACNIGSRTDGWSIKPAIRLSYLSGQASVDMPGGNSISMFTDPEGRYLDFSLDYRVNASLGGDSLRLEGSSFNLNDKSLRGALGSGFAMDLGLRVSPRPGLDFDAALMDIGSIRFGNGPTNMFNQSTYRYEGADADFSRGEGLNLDSLASFARPHYSHEAYSVSLPAQLALSGSLGLAQAQGNKDSYFRHRLSILYVQGFATCLSATTTPYIGMGYTYSLQNVLHLGINAGVGGAFGFQAGIAASLKAGPLLIGLQSSNVLSLIASKAGRGTDAGLLLALSL